ncbi:MAG: hypothetical protein KKE86_09760 [Planctomycetes bacterium]|nr:hypothetical protein [Planctomycetota bacterium]MCG2682864.1 hypothetical protein [Planctomycetales bacterium]
MRQVKLTPKTPIARKKPLDTRIGKVSAKLSANNPQAGLKPKVTTRPTLLPAGALKKSCVPILFGTTIAYIRQYPTAESGKNVSSNDSELFPPRRRDWVIWKTMSRHYLRLATIVPNRIGCVPFSVPFSVPSRETPVRIRADDLTAGRPETYTNLAIDAQFQ